MKHGERIRREMLRMGLQLLLVDPALVTARRVARELKMTHGAVLYHFGSTAGLHDAIAMHAVKQGESKAIAYFIAIGHKAVRHMSNDEKQMHVNQCIKTT